jgi:hypothetical protein
MKHDLIFLALSFAGLILALIIRSALGSKQSAHHGGINIDQSRRVFTFALHL